VILAIDPGCTQSAWLLYNPNPRSTFRIPQCAIEPNETLIERLRESNFDFMPSDVAIEMIASYGMPVGKEVFETVRWIGRFEEATRGVPTELICRRDVKLHLCNSARAKDVNVRAALLDLVGPQGTKKAPGPTYGLRADLWAALGVAVTFAAREAVA
jgi:hypothetical protein